MKRIKYLMVIVLAMFLVACGEKDEFTGIREDARYSKTYQIVSTSKEGVFYKGTDDMLYFRPAETGEAMIFCYDPNCIHEPASEYNPDPTCRGALFTDKRTEIAYYEGVIYYFVWDGPFEHELYRMEVNGAGRTLFVTLPYLCEPLGGVVFYEDKMYYRVVEKKPIDELGTLESKLYIIEINLNNGDYRLVTDEIEGGMYEMDVTDKYVYPRLADSNGDLYRVRYDKDSCDREVIVTPDEYKSHIPLAIYDEYYIYSNGVDKIGIKYFDSGEKKVLVDIDMNGADFVAPCVSGNGVFYRVLDFSDDFTSETLLGAYFYNILTGELFDITEKTLELNIWDYNGYQEYFICDIMRDTYVVDAEEVLESGEIVSR